MPRNAERSVPPRFEVGAKVRVRHGVRAPDFPDIPQGGWTGTITGIEQGEGQAVYEIEWDTKTLGGMHPVYRKRCERDGLALESMWLADEDLEADDGTPVPIEQPTEIRTPPLSKKDQDDRVRMALGLTHDDPLPEISHETLSAYHRYLAANLTFPFTAICGEEAIGPHSRRRITMTVTGLLDPEDSDLTVEDGLICTGQDRGEVVGFPLGEIEVQKRDPNSRLVSDYAYWFHNWPSRLESDLDQELYEPIVGLGAPPPRPWGFLKTVILCGLACGLLGATIGAALTTIRGAGLAALNAGIPPALVGGMILGRYGVIFGAVNRLRYSAFLGVLLGLVVGGLIGVLAGLMVVALPWSFVGLIVGMFLGPYVLPQGRRRLISLRAAALGTCGGIFVSSFRHDLDRATVGVISGSIIGTIAGAGFFIALIGALSLFPAGPMWSGWTDGKPGEPDGDDGDGILPMRPISGRRR